MESTVSQWIHDVQNAVIAGEIDDVDDLRHHPSIGEDRYDRLFSICNFDVTDDGFECKICIKQSIDSNETTVRFDDDTVPSKITLEDK